jgi:hypothetical protein
MASFTLWDESSYTPQKMAVQDAELAVSSCMEHLIYFVFFDGNTLGKAPTVVDL